MRRRFVAVAFVLALVIAGTATAIVPASKLTDKLFTTPFLESELPTGFSGAKVTLEKKTGKQIGRVAVEVNGPDVGHFVTYSVFPSRSVAAERLGNPKLDNASDTKYRYVGSVPGWGKQSKMYVGTISGKNVFGKDVKNGFTLLAVLRGPVIVTSVPASATSEESGDMQAARKMLGAGVRHLDRVQSKGG